MKKLPLQALASNSGSAPSAIVGAPIAFSLGRCIGNASQVDAAIAFGHMSGWSVLQSILLANSHLKMRILFGTAFFQTEPKLLILLQEHARNRSGWEIRLANTDTTFHPKVWLVKNSLTSVGIVGSGNLSKGGLLKNVELALYTENLDETEARNKWFALHWNNGIPLDQIIGDYTKAYEKAAASRRDSDNKMQGLATEFATKHGDKQKTIALLSAKKYWKSKAGKMAIIQHVDSIQRMREILRFPSFSFTASDWIDFLAVDEFGWIRRAHTDKTVASINKLKYGLRKCLSDGFAGLDQLMQVPGIGPNIATKLLAMCDSNSFVVYNSPVESALSRFGLPTKSYENLNSETYKSFLKSLEPFLAVCESEGIDKASAMDSFFYEYRLS